MALDVEIPYTSYNKIENGTRDVNIEELERIAKYFGMTIDQIVHFLSLTAETSILLQIKNIVNQNSHYIFFLR